MNLLLIEDDDLLGKGIHRSLSQQGYNVEWMKDGRSGLAAALQLHNDVVILDLNLPYIDGLDLLNQVRQAGINSPVLILTARDALEDRLKGLDSGADDYLLKPFSLAELEARVRALYRRSQGRPSERLHYNNIEIDTLAREVFMEGVAIPLGRKEYELLLRLVECSGRVQTRSRLAEHLYSMDEEVESNALEVHVHNLRKKLGKSLIQTVRGVGYRVAKL